ncbi:guanylate kinase [Desulfonema magnum]|uniref:Guanylate kinase n=1 Tax=Desulfonema magnum TaxID=45655 RepID=A0A975BTV4_9BACT|nr:guanylate kinase [Desulfonema magnum]QTA91508.1 Guanylate kinase [Desulfonema magnum]
MIKVIRMCKQGRLFIISAPSGTGKTTLCNILLEQFPDIRFSISHTTREPRTGETDGVEYYFITKEAFIKGMETAAWAEWAEVHGNFYGTSSEVLNRTLGSGQDILLDIDVQGAIQILRQYPDSVTIFIMPPSSDVLKARLESRGTDTEEVIAARLINAEKEMAEKDRYRHIIVNDRLPEAAAELISIVEKYRC